ncbi:aspartyl protease family protein [Sorangium sp. So ce281]|uniref:aspartyl protease family protein n=1 Tax=unclassified Sorangium TaxID=2621164 RepID=UPI003F5FDB59
MRHAQAYGTPDAILASLPRTFRMEVETEGKKGSYELALDRTRFRAVQELAGVRDARGVNAEGPWQLGVPDVFVRLRPEEAVSLMIDGFVARREYVVAFDPARDKVRCADDAPGRVTIALDLPPVGSPELEFALDNAALVAVTSSRADGERATVRFDAWTKPDARGVSWPASTTRLRAVAEPEKRTLVAADEGLSCPAEPPGKERAQGEACLAPPHPRLEIAWPASGVVRVPMKHYLGEVSFRAKIGGRETWAMLDSGASLTVVDATTQAGATFVSTMEVSGTGSTQKIRVGLGELPSLDVGGLALRRVPTVSVPIPMLEAFGNRRPEVILGYSFFLASVVRVDYAKEELVFARSTKGLVDPGATSIPFRIEEDRWVTDVLLDGTPAPVQIDTGNSKGISLVKRWAGAHGFPGTRPALAASGRSGAGVDATSSTLFRLASAKLGPITLEDRVVSIDDPPGTGHIAGLLGNDMLARCGAVVFDVATRTMHLVPPCDRPRPEALAGWKLAKKESPEAKGRPWIIERVLPGSAAIEAGLTPGDRILDVGGIAAELDVSNIQKPIEQKPGTKVVVNYVRDGKREKTTMVLKRVLSN